MGTSGDATAQPPWASSRRPLVVFALIVLMAVAAMAASVGWPNVRTAASAPIPSAFIAQASRACAASLGLQRPATLPLDAASVTADGNQVASLTVTLQQLAASTGARPEVATWLDAWEQYAADEQQRGASLVSRTSLTPAPPPAPSGPTSTGISPAGGHAVMSTPDPALLAQEAQGVADRADHFAGINDLQTCTILARAPASQLAIPS